MSAGYFSPDAGQPWLLFARQAGRPIVVADGVEAGVGHVARPAVVIMVAAVAWAVPAFAIVAARVGAEQHAAVFQRRVQGQQHGRQRHARHVEQRGVGVDAVEVCAGKSRWTKSYCHTSQPLWARAISTKRAEPSMPVAWWPRARKVFRSRPGPQPRSSRRYGAVPVIAPSRAAMFWLTSWSMVPAKNCSAVLS